jgi:ribosomal RNA-processing protein 9
VKNDYPEKGTKSKNFKVKPVEAFEEEINSDDEAEHDAASDASSIDEPIGADNEETPQNKRLRLAKKYLADVEEEEKLNNADDDVAEEHISTRLREDYLDSVGKLRRMVAEKYTGFEEDAIKVFKDKKQKSPITCICLSLDDKIMFTGSKQQFIVKYDLVSGEKLGKIDCSTHSPKKAAIMCMALSSNSKFLVSHMKCLHTAPYLNFGFSFDRRSEPTITISKFGMPRH